MNSMLKTDILQDSILKHSRRDMVILSADQTVGDALAALRGEVAGDRILYLYVVDQAGKLTGVVPVRRLLMGNPEQKIGEIMVGQVISVPGSASMLEACDMILEHRLLALPVVDEEGKPVGINYRHSFRPDRKVSPDEAGWLLVSVGPDRWLGATDNSPGPPDTPFEMRGTIYQAYDPTNGTISTGNIFGAQFGGIGDGASMRLMQKVF